MTKDSRSPRPFRVKGVPWTIHRNSQASQCKQAETGLGSVPLSSGSDFRPEIRTTSRVAQPSQIPQPPLSSAKKSAGHAPWARSRATVQIQVVGSFALTAGAWTLST